MVKNRETNRDIRLKAQSEMYRLRNGSRKKIFCTLSASLAMGVLMLSGCSNSDNSISTTSDDRNNSSTSVFDSNSVDEQNSSQVCSLDQHEPNGEPTFLTTPDGTPIYTSEITNYQHPSELHGTHEQYPLDTFNMETFTDVECPEIVCDGFAYAFTPCFNVYVLDEPDKFTEIDGLQIYSGEELPPSSEYFRLKVGDKFGGLTVKSAQTRFSNGEAQWYDGKPGDIPGIYLTGAEIKYEGEVEMTGCVGVCKTEGYNTEGDLFFFPTGNSASQIPAVQYRFRSDIAPKGIYHEAATRTGGYGELIEISLGNMYDYDIDFNGLKPGDNDVRVKITIKNPVVSYADSFMSCSGEPASVELLK